MYTIHALKFYLVIIMASNSKKTKAKRANRDEQLAKRRHAKEQAKLKKARSDEKIIVLN